MCKSCASGKTVDKKVAETCDLTRELEYNALSAAEQTDKTTSCTDAKFCSDCASGTAGEGGVCKACVPGTYQNEVGKAACLQCPAGQYQNEANKNSCKDCAAGKSLSYAGANNDECTACETGQHQPAVGKTSCPLCPAGQSQPQTEQTACAKCVAGKHASSAGMTDW